MKLTAAQAPKTPLLEWPALFAQRRTAYPGVLDLPHVRRTTSGRAAIHAALQMMALTPGSWVGVPTYHCPTMVAPILMNGLRPLFYAIGEDGLPLLETLQTPEGEPASAVIAPHYFGMPRSMRAVRQWCEERKALLIEDCAHTLVGMAGDRPVGGWGHFATASLSKFYPVQEAGIVASSSQRMDGLEFKRCSIKRQLKSALDPLEIASRHDRLWGIRHLLFPMLALKDRLHVGHVKYVSAERPAETEAEMFSRCDMSRVDQEVPWASKALQSVLPISSVVKPRQRNFQIYWGQLGAHAAVHDVWRMSANGCAPYVFPLRIKESALADHIYHTLREEGYPVYRWDWLWPGTPLKLLNGQDCGAIWSREVIQLLCHQSLGAAVVQRTAEYASELLRRGCS